MFHLNAYQIKLKSSIMILKGNIVSQQISKWSLNLEILLEKRQERTSRLFPLKSWVNSFLCLFIYIFIYSFVGWIINIHWVNTTWQTLAKHFSSTSLIRCFYAYQSGISTPPWMAAMNENLTNDWQHLRLNRYCVFMKEIDFSTYDWATSLSLFTFMHWRRKWQPTPVFLPGESQGRRSLVGCHLWGHTESDTTEVT